MTIGHLAGPSGNPFLGKVMRIALLCLGIGALGAAHGPLTGNLTAIPLLNTECAQVGDISFGADGNWAHCHVTKSHWFSRIAFIDLYQAQYCLGSRADHCDHTALLVFANYPFTPIGRLLVERIDPAGTEYDEPVVASTAQERVLILSTHMPDTIAGAAGTKSYYRWANGGWLRINEIKGSGVASEQRSGSDASATRAAPDVGKTHSWFSSVPGWRHRLLPD